MHGKRFTRIFFATDLHGSERTFRKFVNAAKFYKADVLVLGGDVTGKMVVPIVEVGNATYRTHYLGRDEIMKTPEELQRLESIIAGSGYYTYRCSQSEMEELKASKANVDKLFVKVMKETVNRWVQFAEQALRESGATCYITGGNDDLQEVLDEIKDTEHVKNVDNKVIKIDQLHEMANIGWSNPTPWKCPRECDEDELWDRIERLMVSVADPRNCVFNFHSPPKDCGLDTVMKLDDSVDPPKPVIEGGQPVMVGAGSEAVRHAIGKYKPPVDLCGHVHESRGTCRIESTLIVNPGSEYTEGVLRGAIVNMGDKKVLSWQLTSG
jgi:Icc-related predicted phosphoesterase